MARPYADRDDRPRCSVNGCDAPRTVAYVFTRKKDGLRRTVYRAVCSWHHRNPFAVHPSKDPARQSRVMCQRPGCTQAARILNPGADGRPRYAATCRSCRVASVPGHTNPHVAAALAELPRAQRKAANVKYDPKKKTYIIGARLRTKKKGTL